MLVRLVIFLLFDDLNMIAKLALQSKFSGLCEHAVISVAAVIFEHTRSNVATSRHLGPPLLDCRVS